MEPNRNIQQNHLNIEWINDMNYLGVTFDQTLHFRSIVNTIQYNKIEKTLDNYIRKCIIGRCSYSTKPLIKMYIDVIAMIPFENNVKPYAN